MPWNESTVISERNKFVRAYLSSAYQMTELCALYGVSRPTGYKWVRRFLEGGRAGLVDRSRAPQHCPHRMSEETQRWSIKARKRFGWGARKLLKIFRTQHPRSAYPSRSAISALLKREGLVNPRRQRHRRAASGGPRRVVTAPNQLWTVDFKGQFRLDDRRWCYPLTLMDHFSRYLLLCRGLPDCSGPAVQQHIDRVFRQYGLPEAIHSDNGAPFASPSALAGLTHLSVHWIKLGIRIERSRPGCPQDNGAHERMHRTLKDCTARPPAANLRAQQGRFNRFRREYNELRPHESIEDRTPSALHRPSPRPYPARIPKPEYPHGFDTRRVSHNGYVSWRAEHLFISSALAHEYIAFVEIDDGLWSLYFYHQLLGRFDARAHKLIPL